jgi:ATP-dependent protease Clp ATPase subunit
MSEPITAYCSFCGKSQHEVEVMLAGPVMAFICKTCVADAAVQVERILTDRREQEKLNREAVRCACCAPAPVELRHG